MSVLRSLQMAGVERCEQCGHSQPAVLRVTWPSPNANSVALARVLGSALDIIRNALKACARCVASQLLRTRPQ